jgi:hypothetical protein
MLFECSWGSVRRSISCVFQALPLLRDPTPPNRNYGVAYMDQYARPFHQTSPRSPKLWYQERFEPGRRFGNPQPLLFPSTGPNYQTDSNNDHNAPVNCPLWIAGHIITWQDVDALQEKRASRQNEQYTKDIQNYFHRTFQSLRDYNL